jgi:hypothetical protein
VSLNAWRAFGPQAGLSSVELLLEDRDGLNRLVMFSGQNH